MLSFVAGLRSDTCQGTTRSIILPNSNKKIAAKINILRICCGIQNAQANDDELAAEPPLVVRLVSVD